MTPDIGSWIALGAVVLVFAGLFIIMSYQFYALHREEVAMRAKERLGVE